MKIDRSNYEIWFIDWLDGNLDSHQVEQLNLFLNENPGLKEEFNELTSVKIEPSGTPFKNIKLLRKSPSDLTTTQFEYLCVAYLENDLSSDQKSELMEIIDQDVDKRRSFTLIQKSKLVPVDIKYRNRNTLRRRTPMQKVIRLSVIGLSAAAAVTLILTTYLNIPGDIATLNSSTIIANRSEAVVPKETETVISGKLLTDTRSIPVIQKKENASLTVKKEKITIGNSELAAVNQEDSVLKNFQVQDFNVKKINLNSDIGLKEVIGANTLIASNISYTIPSEDDGRSNIGRFLSKTFREAFLKENITPDSPLKGYEIAEAGVSGLNKLLGWEMALDKNNDENGELSSVYFSSRLLKFNTPVKKSQPLP